MGTLIKSRKSKVQKAVATSSEVVSYETNSLSQETYDALHSAFDHFNAELFNGKLPQCILTIRRRRGARGLFSVGQFEAKDGSQSLDEIAMNPESFKRDEVKVVSTLVHEMVHLWQAKFGKPSRNGYHNKEWAAAMELIGLMPSTTGEPDGRKTGSRVTHYIIEGGPYEQSFYRWSMRDRIKWAAVIRDTTSRPAANKTKYQCGNCGNQVWGRPAMLVACLECKCIYLESGKTEADYQSVLAGMNQ